MRKTLKFQTNINCGSCVKSVSGVLNDLKTIDGWEVDTEDPRKVLSVHGENIKAENIIKTVYDIGFDIEELQTS